MFFLTRHGWGAAECDQSPVAVNKMTLITNPDFIAKILNVMNASGNVALQCGCLLHS